VHDGHGQKPANRYRKPLMNRGLFAIALLALLPACARFEPRPLSSAESAASLENRSLDSPGLKSFLEQNLKRDFTNWPVARWDLDMLTLAAFYYQPALEIARAQLAVAKGGETTAGQRPNPTLTITPGYDTTPSSLSPWFPLTMLDVMLETAGKRRFRKAHAGELAEGSRLNIATVAWQVRSELRSNVVDFSAVTLRENLLRRQVLLQEQIDNLQQEQMKAGAISSSETFIFRIALQKAQLDLADVQRQLVEIRSRLAEAIGMPVRALDRVEIAFDFGREPGGTAELTSAEARRAALQSRTDILAALAEYAASQASLQLEIAKQYPDIHLQPGYQYDQGDNKWSLGIVLDLPIFHQNQGPIAEAKARREEAAARFNALQARVLAELDRSVEVFRINLQNIANLRALAEIQTKRRELIEAQLKAGAVEPLDLLNVQVEAAAADVAQLDGQTRLQQAIGALESAVQLPFPLPAAIFESRRTDAH